MPQQTQRPCSHVGCPALTRERYCPQHINSKKKEQSAARKQLPPRVKNPIYSTARWKKVRLMVLRRDPVCVTEGCRSFTSEVDHIVPLAKGGGAYDMENLQGLCKPCHARKTQSEQQQERRELEEKKR